MWKAGGITRSAGGSIRRLIWEEDADRHHFLDLLEQMAERFQVRVHAYVLMVKPKAVAPSVRLMNMKLTDAQSAPSRKIKLAEREIQSLET